MTATVSSVTIFISGGRRLPRPHVALLTLAPQCYAFAYVSSPAWIVEYTGWHEIIHGQAMFVGATGYVCGWLTQQPV